MKRRTFVEKTVQAGIALSVMPVVGCGDDSPRGYIPRRKLGKTDEMLSIIGFGGILVDRTSASEASGLVSRAIDLGVNYFDVAPSYGNAEEMLGPALEPYRKNNFLACKTLRRDAAGAGEEMDASLRKLRTDYFDLYQLHAISSVQQVEECFGTGGAMETVLKAQEAGKIRFIGFSAHSDEAALRAMELFDFDSILMPFNFVCMHQGNFGNEALEAAKEKGMGILALKALALTGIPAGQGRPYEKLWYIPIEDHDLASKSLRYTLSLGVTAAIPPGDVSFWELAVQLAAGNLELSATERQDLLEEATAVTPLFRRG